LLRQINSQVEEFSIMRVRILSIESILFILLLTIECEFNSKEEIKKKGSYNQIAISQSGQSFVSIIADCKLAYLI